MSLISAPLQLAHDHDGVYNLFALRYASTDRRAPDNFLARDVHDGPMPLDYNLWIVCNRHRLVLVDTGFGDEAAVARNRPRLLDPVASLARLGIDVSAIEDVVITHLHYDHAGNLGDFKKARFHVQTSEGAYATGRHMSERHLRMPYDVDDAVAFVRHVYAERVVFHEGDASPWPGIGLHLLPGHSPGMQAVTVNTARGIVVLASDVSHYYANFVRRSPFAISIDTAATLDSYSALLRLGVDAEHVVPGHDPLVRKFYPRIQIDGVELSLLHEHPLHFDMNEIVDGPFGCA